MGLRIQGRAVEARLLQKWCTLQAGFVRSRYLNQAGDVLGSAKKTGQEVMFQGSGFRVQDSRFRVTPAGGAQDGWGSRKTGGLCGVWKHNCQSTRVKQSENTGERLYQSRSGLKSGWKVSFDEICWQKIFRLSVRERTESTHFDRNLRGGVKPQSQ